MVSPVLASLGRTAFVTGGAQGIGRAISLRLARDGYDVSIGDLPSQQQRVQEVVKEIETLGRKAIGVAVDVGDAKQVESAIAETVEKLGPNLFVSVANAGISRFGPLLEITSESLELQVRINLIGVMNTHIAAAKQMVKQGTGGRIIGAASIAAFRTHEYFSTYCATKFAVRGFTEAAAKEWGHHGIRVNAYAPGIVDTPMLNTLGQDMGKLLNVSAEDVKASRVKQDVKLGRIQEPEDVAKVVSFLASEEGEYITGQTIKTCGGASL